MLTFWIVGATVFGATVGALIMAVFREGKETEAYIKGWDDSRNWYREGK